MDDIIHHRINSFGVSIAQNLQTVTGHIVRRHDPSPNGVIDVMIDVSDDVRNANHLPFERSGHGLGILAEDLSFSLGMLQDTLSYLKREIQSLSVLFQKIDHPQALIGMIESPGNNLIQGVLPGMTKRGMTEVVTQ